MTVLLRSFLVWLMLLALPYQGYASAQMLLCVAPAPAKVAHDAMAMPSGPHDHAAMMAAQSAHAQHDNDSNASQSGHHTGSKCTGSACCAAAAPLLTLDVTAPALPLAARLIAFYSDFLPAVDLAHPERPPQGRYA